MIAHVARRDVEDQAHDNVPAVTSPDGDGGADTTESHVARGAEGASGRAGRSPALGPNTNSPSTAGQGPEPRGYWWTALRPHSERPNDDPAVRRDVRRQEKWAMRRALRKVYGGGRIVGCGLPTMREDECGSIEWTDNEDGTRTGGTSGLYLCGQVWLCPVCSEQIAMVRAEYMSKVIAKHVEQGAHVVMVTLTMRHYAGHTLRECLDGSAAGWAKVTSGRAWHAQRRDLLRGYVSALELTVGPNSWHVHHHVVLVFDERPSDDALDDIAGAMFARWSGGLVAAGMPAPDIEYGLDVRRMDEHAGGIEGLARYVTKGLTDEAVKGITKRAKGPNRSIRELMQDATGVQLQTVDGPGEIVNVIDLNAVRLLREYEREIKGRRQLNWSRNDRDLRKILDEDEQEELTDEEIVAGQEVERQQLGKIHLTDWVRLEPEIARLIGVLEREGPEAARQYAVDEGIPLLPPDRFVVLTVNERRKRDAAEDNARATAQWRKDRNGPPGQTAA